MSNLKIHAELCDNLKEVYRSKNADYGDSFKKIRDKFGNVAILIRIADKQSRLETLMLNPNSQQVKDESIDDTLIDLANYCLLELTERIADREQCKLPSALSPILETDYKEPIECDYCGNNNKSPEQTECLECNDYSRYKQAIINHEDN